MSCCGQKRKAWMQEQQALLHPAELQTHEYAPANEQPDIWFVYTGSSSIKIEGHKSGSIYHFQYPGHKLEVNHADSFSMMAEPDIEKSKGY